MNIVDGSKLSNIMFTRVYTVRCMLSPPFPAICRHYIYIKMFTMDAMCFSYHEHWGMRITWTHVVLDYSYTYKISWLHEVSVVMHFQHLCWRVAWPGPCRCWIWLWNPVHELIRYWETITALCRPQASELKWSWGWDREHTAVNRKAIV